MTAATLARLREVVAAHASATPPGHARRALPPIEQILRGTWHEGGYGHVFVRDDWYALDHCHGTFALGSALDAPAASLGRLLGGDPPGAERLAFFDIETTGLSGGTGTYVVLAGLGSYERAGAGEPLAFRLRQYFLADIARERAMLAMLAEDLGRFEGIVTYNGRAFDVPFVETRLTLARIPSPCAVLAHFDLLHGVRRLYRHRMSNCTLAEVERRLLRIDRADDVPGRLIPALYFDYVRAGRAAPLRGVFRHNAEDVLSLVGVLARLAGMLSGEALDADDAAAVGRWWEFAREPVRAMRLYERALPWLRGGDDWRWVARRFAALAKRHGQRAEAVPLWDELWREGDGDAGLELAKHYEHHAGDLLAAEEITRALMVRATEAGRIALAHRLGRVQRKRRRAERAGA